MPNAGDYVRASDTTRYYAKATQSSTQSLSTATFTAIQLNATDDVDNLGIHDPVTNNTRFNIGLAIGWWLVCGKFTISWSAANQGRRSRLVMNGATGVNGGFSAAPTLVTGTGGTSGFWTMESSTLIQTTLSSDYVELHGYQDSGGSLSTVVSGDLRCQMYALYLGS